jgi:hypothetical protein
VNTAITSKFNYCVSKIVKSQLIAKFVLQFGHVKKPSAVGDDSIVVLIDFVVSRLQLEHSACAEISCTHNGILSRDLQPLLTIRLYRPIR